MPFFSRCNRPATVTVPVGNLTTPTYEERLDNGVHRLIKVGVTNLFDFVQASKEETLVYNILDRFAKGDPTALMAKRGQFLDVVGMPSTLAEAQQLMINATEKFNSLPADVRAKFDNDVHKYVNQVANASLDDLKEMFGEKSPAPVVKDGDGNVAE